MKKRNRRRQIKIYNIKDDLSKRTKIIMAFGLVFFVIIFARILYLNIYMSGYYNMLLNNNKQVYVYGESTSRGRILDRNGKVLVDNKAVKSIIYKKPGDIKKEDEIKIAYKISNILKLNYNKLTTRNKKEFYILINKEKADKLISKEEYLKLENRKLTENDIYELKIKRITKEMLKDMDKDDNKAAYIYYLMNKGYYYEEKIIKENVTDKEYAYFSENNLSGFRTKLVWEREYPYGNTLRSIFGSVSSKETGIPYENKDYYLQNGYTLNDRVGTSGLEKQYEDILKGEKAVYKLDKDNNLLLVKEGTKGSDIVLSIDIDLQRKIDKMVEEELIKAKREANTEYFNKSYIVITNPNNGEIMSITGKGLTWKNGYYMAYDIPEEVFLATITPGSVVKGAGMMVGYTTGAIKIGTVMQDTCIKLYNLPEKCSWRTLGYVNDLQALEFSSNVYQYKIAMKVGGFDYSYGKVLKIDKKAFDKYRNIFYQFGLGVKTGIDFPKEEDGYKVENRAGDLLINFAIGQYDTYTTMQLSQYASVLANSGTRYKYHFVKGVITDGKEIDFDKVVLNKLNVKKKYVKRVRKGLRLVMTGGTGIGYMDSAPAPSGKTGTSESLVDINGDNVMDKETISSNFIGYAPMNHPIMTITGAFPNIQNPAGGSYKSYANQTMISKATKIFFNLYDKNGKKIKKS